MSSHLDPETFLSGDSGEVSGIRLPVIRAAQDAGLNALAALTATGPRLDRLARRAPPRRVTVLSAYRPGRRLEAALPALRSERHEVRFSLEPVEGSGRGKFQNLNRALERRAGGGLDAGGRRRRGAAPAVPRPLHRSVRGDRAGARPARPDAPQPRGVGR